MLVQRDRKHARFGVATLSLLMLFMCGVLAGVPELSAQEAPDVYGPPAPRNAGFIRLVNAGTPGNTISTTIGSRSYGPLAFGDVTPYRPVRSGIYLATVAGARGEVIVSPDSYHTVAAGGDEIRVISDTRHEDPARAQLVLYNLLPSGRADLLVAPNGTAVIQDVDAGTAEARAVNAVTAGFTVLGPSGARISAGELELSRGDSFGIFLIPAAGAPTVVSHRATVELDE